jgi:hypothetical protein
LFVFTILSECPELRRYKAPIIMIELRTLCLRVIRTAL